VLVRGLEKIVEVAAGGLHTCALTVGGMVECWGSNVSGEVGGTDKESLRARIVTGLSMASAIAVGDSQSCAVTTAGGVECWGSNAHGGEHGLRSMPVKVHGFHGKVVSLAVGSSHTCALLRAGSVECWGDNDKGQLGGGNAGTPSSRPVPVIGFGQ
jgi:alpha-tubulin suppressor-like RCC1 family protein